MFNRLITKLFLKLNPDKEIISKDDLNALEKAKRDYIALYKQNMLSTRKEYDVRTYVAVEFVDRDYIGAFPDYEEQKKKSLVNLVFTRLDLVAGTGLEPRGLNIMHGRIFLQ